MKRLALLLTLLIPISLLSQSCLPEGIKFTTQVQIDSFQIDYPGCTEILGNVTIVGDDITNLSGLIGITSIGGDFMIDRADSLTCLDGLDSLTLVQGDLDIGNSFSTGQHGNPSLTNINALDNLISAGGRLAIYGNSHLTNLEGLNHLTSTGDDLLIISNGDLVNLIGLNNLVSIEGSLLISFNPLSSLTGFDNLTSIGGGLTILGMSNLTNLTGLENLTTMNGTLNIGGWNPGLGGNPLLTSLTGLENISAGSIDDLTIAFNYSLSSCAIQNICDYLVAPNGEVYIEANAPGCNSPEELEEACETVSIDEASLVGEITSTPNPFTTSTTMEYELKQPSTVQLSVYNQLGQLVHQQSEDQSQGIQQLQWDAHSQNEGIYYFTLQAGEQVATGKVILIR